MWVMGEWAVGQWIVGVTSFQKIFGLCGLKCHIVEIWRDVTLEDDGRNVKIGLEFWKQNSQFQSTRKRSTRVEIQEMKMMTKSPEKL